MLTGITFNDAARILGANRKAQAYLRQGTGAVLAAASISIPAMAAFLGTCSDFVGFCGQLILSLQEKKRGISRWTRTERLQAANGLLVISAFFKAMNEANLPINISDLSISKDEATAIAGTGVSRG